uniref:Uncharacterized protein n=1 Tax=Lates calcarifer TaxID=8187 RepID=A0A4W6FQQ9_LATCA
MGEQGRLIGGLVLCLMGILGVCVVCGLPMWRETSFVGANIVTVWDGLWLHCIVQATGQMQCKRHTSSVTLTVDIQAGRALTLISIIAGLLGFIACLLGGALCILSGILCLVSVTWSAGLTISIYNDPFVAAPLKREVGSSIYIGWVSSVLLLLGGALICFVCRKKERLQPPYYPYVPYSSSAEFGNSSSHMATLRSDVTTSNSWRTFNRTPSGMVEHVAQVHNYNSMNKAQSGVGPYNRPQGTKPGSEQGTLGRNPSNRSGTPDKCGPYLSPLSQYLSQTDL